VVPMVLVPRSKLRQQQQRLSLMASISNPAGLSSSGILPTSRLASSWTLRAANRILSGWCATWALTLLSSQPSPRPPLRGTAPCEVLMIKYSWASQPRVALLVL
jgi:hypothetical protein